MSAIVAGRCYRIAVSAGYALLLLAMLAGTGREPDVSWLALAPFLLLVVSPISVGILISGAGKGPRSRAMYTMLVTLVAVAGLLFYYKVLFVDRPDAQSALAFVSVPFSQWIGIAVAALAAQCWPDGQR